MCLNDFISKLRNELSYLFTAEDLSEIFDEFHARGLKYSAIRVKNRLLKAKLNIEVKAK